MSIASTTANTTPYAFATQGDSASMRATKRTIAPETAEDTFSSVLQTVASVGGTVDGVDVSTASGRDTVVTRANQAVADSAAKAGRTDSDHLSNSSDQTSPSTVAGAAAVDTATPRTQPELQLYTTQGSVDPSVGAVTRGNAVDLAA
jgi:hypothetical protein